MNPKYIVGPTYFTSRLDHSSSFNLMCKDWLRLNTSWSDISHSYLGSRGCSGRCGVLDSEYTPLPPPPRTPCVILLENFPKTYYFLRNFICFHWSLIATWGATSIITSDNLVGFSLKEMKILTKSKKILQLHLNKRKTLVIFWDTLRNFI